jgi:hypothetical protein
MNYLRTHRLKTALSQDDTAFLLGLESGANVSRHETGARVPDLVRVLAYAALYHTQVEVLYPEEYRRVEADISSRAGVLAERVRKAAPSPLRERKLSVLRDLEARNERNDWLR